MVAAPAERPAERIILARVLDPDGMAITLAQTSSQCSRFSVATVCVEKSSTSVVPWRSQEVHLAARPQGMPERSDFAVIEMVIPDAVEGKIQVRKRHNSIDPATPPRLAMQQLGTPPWGFCV